MIHFLACVVLCCGLHSCKPSELATLYAQSNRTYFANHLPKHPRFVIQELGRKPNGREIMAETVVAKRRVTIYVSPRFLQHDLRTTVIHEQCHVWTSEEPEEHGPRWKACMESRGLLGQEQEQ